MNRIDHDHLKIFGARSGSSLARLMAEYLALPLGQAETELFPDGELIVRVEEDVRGRDCFVVQSTCDPVNANIMELLIYIDCLRRASAQRITAVIPYFGYGRQDRKDAGRTPITVSSSPTWSLQRARSSALHALHAPRSRASSTSRSTMSAMTVFCDYFTSIRGNWAIW